MKPTLLSLYHTLPPPLRSLAASVRGWQLRRWRYGPDTEALIDEASSRESWSAAQWQRWREEHLAALLHRAATVVPYYRAQWRARRQRGDQASWEDLDNWPLLEKAALRQQPRAFVADDCDRRQMWHEHTSGTTGTPLELWWSRATVRAFYALWELRVRRWHGVSRHEPWALLGGQLVVPPQTREPPFWVWNRPLKQLYLSATHLSRAHVRAYLLALTRHQVTHLITYASAAAVLADEAARLGLGVPGLRAVATNAEPLTPGQRETITRGLGAPVFETYSMAEIVLAASSCAAGSLHLWPEVGWPEVLSDTADTPVPPGTVGRLVGTSLLNADMPLIRYALGDRGGLAPAGTRCACGGLLPVLLPIEGRSTDVLTTPDGRRVWWLNPVFYGLPVCEAQIVQETLERLRVRYVPAAPLSSFGAAISATLVERVQARMGAVEVILEPVAQVPRDASGKFRAVISEVPADVPTVTASTSRRSDSR
jgi:phenylacetate-CoA ligase